jgi:hypothetical protein
MARKQIWFGHKGLMMEVPCPDINVDVTNSRISEDTGLLNGGMYSYSIKPAAKTYEFSWTNQPYETLSDLKAFIDGAYSRTIAGLRSELIYFMDPSIRRFNMLPSYLSCPTVGVDNDAPTWFASPLNKPGYQVNSLGRDYGVYEAIYPYKANEVGDGNSFYCPVRPGHRAFIIYEGTLPFDIVYDDSTPNEQVIGNLTTPQETVPGVGFTIQSVFPSDPALYPLYVRYFRISVERVDKPITLQKKFFVGDGNSGCRIANVSKNIYSAALNKHTLKMRLVETGAWE